MVDTATRKQQIYEAASALFSRRGYHSTSVRDIARELDLQGGSLYAHIASKEDVLYEIVQRAAAAFQAAVAPLAHAEQPAAARLRAMVHAHVGVVVRDLSHVAVFFQDWRHLSEPRRSEVLALRDTYEALFRDVIVAGVAVGELADCDPRLASIFILTALNGLPGWFKPGGTLSADAIAEQFADLLLAGLAQPAK